MNIDPSAITFVQTTLLQHINAAFLIASKYALNLFYIFVVFEIVLFGLALALKPEQAWADLFFKILKIGLLFFLIKNYYWIITSIMQSFALLAGIVIPIKNLAEFIFNPVLIFQYGYDVGLHLLHAATLGSSFGLVLLEIILGFGILLSFALFCIRIVLQIVGFYLAAFLALIFAPLGVFAPTANMFERTMQGVFKAGVRVMTISIIVAGAVVTFNSFAPLAQAMLTRNYNLNQLLGLFFTSLLFLCLAWYLPKMLADTVGEIKLRFVDDKNYQNPVSPPIRHEAITSQAANTTAVNLNALQAASSLDLRNSIAPIASQNHNLTTTPPTSAIMTQTMATEHNKTNSLALAQRTLPREQSISHATLKNLQGTLTKILQNQNKILLEKVK